MLLIIGCNSPQQEGSAKIDVDKSYGIGSDTAVVNESMEAIWRYDYNQQTKEFELTQLRSVDKNTLTGETVEKIVNNSWPKVQIIFIRTSNDTAFISIPDSRVMTQQMGSAGAEGFMIAATYTLTELKEINYVSFDFEEGDHAQPGVYNRNSWDKNKNQ